jgi:hypothetical protein
MNYRTEDRPSYVAPIQDSLRRDARNNARADIAGPLPKERRGNGNIVAAAWDSLGYVGKLAVTAATLVVAGVAGSHVAPSGDSGTPERPTSAVRHLGYLDQLPHVPAPATTRSGEGGEDIVIEVNHSNGVNVTGQALHDAGLEVQGEGNTTDAEGHPQLGLGQSGENVPVFTQAQVDETNALAAQGPAHVPNFFLDKHN